MPQTTFFIVPGFKQKASDTNFSWLVSFLQKKRFIVIPVPIQWNRKVMSDYIKDFRICYTKHKTDINYVLGFSYGSIITLAAANKLKPKKIFLCSLSPEFAEDIPPMKAWHKKLVGKRRLTDSATRSGRTLAKKLTIPSVIFYGSKEGHYYPLLRSRCEETARLAKNSKLILVPKAPHRIDNPEYILALKGELQVL